MKHVEYWLAKDGTRFDDEQECEAYERMPSIDVVDGLKLLDEDFCEMTLKKGDSNLQLALDTLAHRVMYAKVSTQVALDWLEGLADYTGASLPKKIGTFFWDAEYEGWICIEDLLDELAVIRRKLTNE